MSHVVTNPEHVVGVQRRLPDQTEHGIGELDVRLALQGSFEQKLREHHVFRKLWWELWQIVGVVVVVRLGHPVVIGRQRISEAVGVLVGREQVVHLSESLHGWGQLDVGEKSLLHVLAESLNESESGERVVGEHLEKLLTNPLGGDT